MFVRSTFVRLTLGRSTLHRKAIKNIWEKMRTKQQKPESPHFFPYKKYLGKNADQTTKTGMSAFFPI
jgi:hypothetical protein